LASKMTTAQALRAIASTFVILIIFVAIGMWAVQGIWSTDIVVAAKTGRFNVCVNDAIRRSPGFAAYTDPIGNSSTVVFVHTPLARVGIKVMRLTDTTVQIEGYGPQIFLFEPWRVSRVREALSEVAALISQECGR
jgi:hypothetical protein